MNLDHSEQVQIFDALTENLSPPDQPETKMATFIRAYVAATGKPVGSNPIQAEREEIVAWMRSLEHSMPTINEFGHSRSLMIRKFATLAPLLHLTVAEKASWLQQTQCLRCEPDMTSADKPTNFGIRVRPFSAQSLASRKLSALKSSITANLQKRYSERWSSEYLCVQVVCVIGATEKRKDVDNMVKGLVDAMQGVFYSNDSQIEHLDIQRLSHAQSDSFYLISVKPVQDNLRDVLDTQMKISWAGQDEIVW